MPMLPSGRHIGLSPDPLVKLLENAGHFGNVHKIMALKSWADLYPWIEVLSFVPEATLEDVAVGQPSDDSLPALPGMIAVRSGYRLSEWEKHAADWSEADLAAMREFLEGRAREHFEQHLDYARGVQEKLKAGKGGDLAQVLSWWHHAGVHPAQEEGWTDGGDTHWDTYDLVAALVMSCGALKQGPQDNPHVGQVLARLPAFLGLCMKWLDAAPAIDSMEPRVAAEKWREAKLLETLPAREQWWFHDQAVIECVNVWDLAGEELKAISRPAYDLVELATLSPEGAAASTSPA